MQFNETLLKASSEMKKPYLVSHRCNRLERYFQALKIDPVCESGSLSVEKFGKITGMTRTKHVRNPGPENA
jgi:hypothetical protein